MLQANDGTNRLPTFQEDYAERSYEGLSEIARTEKRNLLAVSALTIALVYLRALPTKISALGIEFAGDSINQRLRVVLGVLVCYFLVAFICYAYKAYLLWRVAYLNTKESALQFSYQSNLMGPTRKDEEFINSDDPIVSRIIVLQQQQERSLRSKGPLFALFVIEFIIPICSGLISIGCVTWAPWK